MDTLSVAGTPTVRAIDDVLTRALARWENDGRRVDPDDAACFAYEGKDKQLVEEVAVTGKQHSRVVS